jgi:sec-independent protein translocase protein TatB
MEFLGIGPLELLFVVIIALIVLGPKDMVKAGKTIGRTLRKIVTSPNWRAIQQTSRELRQLPNRLIRDAGLEDLQKNIPKPDDIGRELGLDEMKKNLSDVGEELSDWTTPPPTIRPNAAPEQPKEPPSPTSNENQTNQD